MSSSSDREDVLVLSQRKDAKSTKESSKGGSETTKHVSTKSASEKSNKDHKSPEPKKSKSSGTPKDKKSDKKEKSKKSQREEEPSDDEDAMEVDDAPAPAKADFVDDLDDEFGLEDKLLEVKSTSKGMISAQDVESDDIELVLVKLPLNFDHNMLHGKKFIYKKQAPKREGEVPKPAQMAFVKKEMVNDKERLEIHEEGELPVVNMVTLLPDRRKGKYTVVNKPLRTMFQITEVFDEEYLEKQKEENQLALDKKMADMRAKANAPDPERLKHVPSWRFSPMMLPPREKPELKVRWGPPGSKVNAAARSSAPEMPKKIAESYRRKVEKAAAATQVSEKSKTLSKKTRVSDDEASDDEKTKEKPKKRKREETAASSAPSTPAGDKKGSKKSSKTAETDSPAEKPSKKKQKNDE